MNQILKLLMLNTKVFEKYEKCVDEISDITNWYCLLCRTFTE